MRFDPRSQIAIVIPAHNRCATTRACIESLRSADGPAVQVIVVDDGSQDDTPQFLADQSDVVTVRASGDLWWTGSVDLGCRTALSRGARTLILLNDDNIVGPNLVPVLSEAVAESRCCVSAVVLSSCERGIGTIFQAGGTLNWRRRGIGLRDTGKEYSPRAERAVCDWLPGCAVAFPAQVYTDVGGFDAKRFPQYRGDIDFTVRARRCGYRCLVTYEAWVLNDLSHSPLSFRRRVPLWEFLAGFFTRRSNYNLREVVAFAWAYCPRRLLAYHLVQFYARYAWASLKTQRLLLPARSGASHATT